jgi:hypothetical protein
VASVRICSSISTINMETMYSSEMLQSNRLTGVITLEKLMIVCPSARCASAANLVCRYVDIFGTKTLSLKHFIIFYF